MATGSWKIIVASGLTSATKGNFVVRVYGSSGFPDLAVNTIGGYSGTVPVASPAALAITSTGSWSITGS